MKIIIILTTVLILVFQSWTKADDIKDFEIEGMSIGDSLLDYMSKDEIISNDEKHYGKNSKFFETEYYGNTETYQYLLFHVKRNDPKYLIYMVRGINIPHDLNECLKNKSNIVKEVKSLFKKSKFREGSQKHYFYKNTTQYISQFDFENQDMVRIDCVIMNEKDLKIHSSIKDTLEVTIYNSEFRKWLDSL